MSAAAKPIPEGYHTVTPYFILSEASEAIAFYERALGAEEVMRLAGPASGRGCCRSRWDRPTYQGSIYENQRAAGRRYFATSNEAPRLAAE